MDFRDRVLTLATVMISTVLVGKGTACKELIALTVNGKVA